MKYIVVNLYDSYGATTYESVEEFLEVYERISDEKGLENVLKFMKHGYQVMTVDNNGNINFVLDTEF